MIRKGFIFLATAALSAAAADDSASRVLMGQGDWTFERQAGWGLLPGNLPPGPTHGGIVTDKGGHIYVSTDGKAGIIVFNADGSVARTMTNGLSGIHGMFIREEDGAEFIYAAHLTTHMVEKLQLDGSKVWTMGFPQDSGLYAKPDQFKPTSVAVAPDGALFVADGYGKSVIHKFDANRNYVKTFGSADAGPGRTATCHGLAIDTQTAPPTLLVCDRENRRISRFDLDGKFIGVFADHLRRPCGLSFFGGVIAVAELEGRVVILDQSGKAVSALGDNPDKGQWANYGVPPANWRDGFFTAPHGVCFDAAGNLFVQDWNSTGRIHKLVRSTKDSGTK